MDYTLIVSDARIKSSFMLSNVVFLRSNVFVLPYGFAEKQVLPFVFVSVVDELVSLPGGSNS